MSMDYNETFFSKLQSDVQENLYVGFTNTKLFSDKLLFFTKFKYGDTITFKDLSEKSGITNVRMRYINFINSLSGNINN